MAAPYGYRVAKVIETLQTFGPMTSTELALNFGCDRAELTGVLTRMQRPGPNTPKRIHISGYVYDTEGCRRYPRAMYAVGDKRDAKKPERDLKANRARYQQSRKSRCTTNSVFNLAVSMREAERRKKATHVQIDQTS